jgi:hypothetical protein
MMRFSSIALCTWIVAVLSGCSSGGSSPGSATATGGMLPQSRHEVTPFVPRSMIKYAPFHGVKAPQSATRGIYVAEFFASTTNIVGFPKNQTSNGPPICTESTGSNVNDLGVDGKGNLLVPGGGPGGVQIYQGPVMCGPLLGTMFDPYGFADAVAANDAVNGITAIASISSSGVGSVVTCRFSTMSCTQLAPNIAAIASVAMDKTGNCYADGFDTSGHVGLWVYTGCAGTGTELTSANGFTEPYYGGMSVDNKGNLVVISVFNSSFTTPSTVTVYSGCLTGTCTVVGGPFALQGESAFGHLGRQNERWVTANMSTSMIDIYAYTGHGTGFTYLYSFNNGLSCATNLCEGAAYSPGSPKL